MFREQAVEHARVRSYGTVLLARPVSYSLLTGVFVLIATAIVALLALLGYTRKAHVPGVLLPSHGLIRVLPPQAGVIAERRVDEGRPVRAGDVLFVLASERATATHANVERAVALLLQERRNSFSAEREQLRLQARQRMDAARRRTQELAAEIRRVDDQLALQQRRVALADEALARYATLRASNFVSAAAVQEKQAELLDQQQRLGELQRTRAAGEREAATIDDSLRDLQVQARRELEASHRSIAAIEQDLAENDARRQVLVRAPQDGTVTAITAERGQSVSASQSLASILPAGSELEAELHAPSRAAGFVRPGMEVLVRYQSYPYQKFGQARGRVREVSSTSMRPEELALPAATARAGSAEPLYRVRVKLDRQAVTAYGIEQPLKSGMLLDASVLLERRRLYEWVLEPLYTVSGRL